MHFCIYLCLFIGYVHGHCHGVCGSVYLCVDAYEYLHWLWGTFVLSLFSILSTCTLRCPMILWNKVHFLFKLLCYLFSFSFPWTHHCIAAPSVLVVWWRASRSKRHFTKLQHWTPVVCELFIITLLLISTKQGAVEAATKTQDFCPGDGCLCPIKPKVNIVLT